MSEDNGKFYMTQREWDFHQGRLNEKLADIDKHRQEDREATTKHRQEDRDAIDKQFESLKVDLDAKIASGEKWSDNNSKLNKSLIIAVIGGAGAIIGVLYERITALQDKYGDILVMLTKLNTKVDQLELEVGHLVSLIPP